MKKTLSLAIAIVLQLLLFPLDASAQLAAFPGADGYAKDVTGGRGGKVYYVTRLDDCPDGALVEGTLRWALNSGDDSPRIVLFATHGTIYLTSKLKMAHSNVSILGQSAPGGGICIAGYPLNITKNNVIVRYIRFRAGDVPDTSLTGLSMENCQRVILDHCSMTWSMEECLTAYDSKYTTIQWCIIGEGLYNSKNSKGSRAYATQWGGEHSTMHHTLITNSHSRSPRFNGVRVYAEQSTAKGHDYQVDSEFANNVIYNWSSYNAIYGGEMSGKFDDQYNRVYMINNYYRPGPSTKRGTTSRRYWVAASAGENSTGSVTAPGQWYVKGNKFELSSKWAPSTTIWSDTELQKVNADNLYGYDTNSSSRAMGYWSLTPSAELRKKSIMETLPYELSGMTYETADDAFKSVTTKAGASLPRYDEVDQRLLAEAAGTTDPKFIGSIGNSEYGIIDSPDNIKLSAHDTFVANGKVQTNYPFLGMNPGDKYAVDTDADGMPDTYEKAVGLNPNDAADGAAVAANGYTNVENYLNGIADGTIRKSDYETSDLLVIPGTGKTITPTFNISFNTTDAAVEGNMPQASTIDNGAPFIMPASTAIFKEGYSFSHWLCGGVSYKVGEALMPTGDMVITPVFVQNTLNLIDRKATSVAIEWDFTAADAPVLAAGKSGVYTAPAALTVTNPSTVIDACLKYDGMKLSVPSYNGATATLTYSDGTTSTVTATTDDAVLALTADASKRLALVKVVLPKVGDGVYRYVPQCAVDESEIFYATSDNIAAADKWMTTNSKSYKEVTALDAAKDDGTTTATLTGVEVNGTTATATKLTFEVTEVKQLRVFVTTSATSTSVKSTPQMTCTPNDGTAAKIIKGTASLTGVSLVLDAADLDPNVGYKVTLSCTGHISSRFVITAIKMVRGKVTEEPTPGPTPGPDPEPKPKHDIFNAAPFDAQVWDAAELTEALAAATSRTDKEKRYRIFLHNGDYDFEKTAKTAIPGNTSLIGESEAGVLIHNNPGIPTSSYQDKTPTLYIDSEQNDVYLQDMTIRQDRDWEAKKSQGQCLALRQRGKRAVYKNVTLQGIQDTYYLNKADGTAYFENSTIAGEVDFIYGDGTMWFEQCTLHPVSPSACITAPNTQTGYRGIVFNACTIESEPTGRDATGFALGRPWGESPAATYLNTTMKVQPLAAGWRSMTGQCVLRFHEYGSKDAQGQALDLSKRSISALSAAAGSDAPVLTAEQAAAYTLASTFTDWAPQTLTVQHTTPQPVLDGTTMVWAPAEGDVFCYAVAKNDSIIGFTTECTYNVDDPSARYSLRVANKMGGLSKSVYVPGSAPLRGDANADGNVSVSDIVAIANYILGSAAGVFDISNADSNLDGSITVTDIVYNAQYILSGEFPAR